MTLADLARAKVIKSHARLENLACDVCRAYHNGKIEGDLLKDILGISSKGYDAWLNGASFFYCATSSRFK